MILTSSWDFSLTNYESVWSILLQIGIVLSALLIGTLLRNVIPFLKKSLIPSSLIGGFILLIVLIICRSAISKELVDKYVSRNTMQILTYHGLGIGFAAMSLKTVKKNKKVSYMKSVETGALTGATYMLQGIIGIAVTVCVFLITKGLDNEIYYDTGFLLPLGFGQGPGNALTWDLNFTNLLIEGKQVFFGNGSVGLSIASIGFIVASIIGVIYINICRHKGHIEDRHAINGTIDVTHFQQINEIEDSDSVDKFSIQIGLVMLAYVLAFCLMLGLAKISSFTNSLAWGFNFIWAVITANIIKGLLNLGRKKRIIKKKYVNNYQMDRISGFAFDVMIVSGVAAIEINDIKRYVWVIIILCVLGTIFTYLYIRLVTKNRFKGYEHEMFVVNFGALTGTASNGMILLREVDPNYVTPAADLYIQSQLPAMVFVAPMLFLINFSSTSLNNTLITLGIFIALFIIYNVFIFRNSLFKRKKVKNS